MLEVIFGNGKGFGFAIAAPNMKEALKTAKEVTTPVVCIQDDKHPATRKLMVLD